MRELLDDEPDWFDDEHTGMTLLDHEEQAMDMALYDGFLIYPTIGSAGEVGEVANKVGKMLRDNEIARRRRAGVRHGSSSGTAWRRNLAMCCGCSQPCPTTWALTSRKSLP